MANKSELDSAELWYALITLYGEVREAAEFPPSGLSPDHKDKNIKKNRRAWNGWACRDLSEINRRNMEKQFDLDEGELDNWSETERERIKKNISNFLTNRSCKEDLDLLETIGIEEFLDRKFNLTTILRNGDEYVERKFHLENKVFTKRIYTNKFIFNDCSFEGSTFRKDCYFNGGVFYGSGAFSGCKFLSSSDFSDTSFLGSAIFRRAEFRGDIKFTRAKITQNAIFEDADFQSSVSFYNAEFRGLTIFNRVKFKKTSNFVDAHFVDYVPRFYETDLNEEALFTANNAKKWPYPAPVHDSEGGKNAYARLRRIMLEQHRPDDEHFFYRQEMAWKAQHEKSPWISWAAINLYGRLSDYGYSLWKPLRWFLTFMLLPTLSILFDPSGSFIGDLEKIGYVLRVSATNMFPLFEFGKQVHQSLLPLGKCTLLWFTISVAQYLASVAFLFLFALALRNRFRLR